MPLHCRMNMQKRLAGALEDAEADGEMQGEGCGDVSPSDLAV
jgi:hypothetical protein